jgi:hypothetical protein
MSVLSKALGKKFGNAFNSGNYFGSFGDWAGGGSSGDQSALATMAGVYGSRPIDLQDLNFEAYADPTAFAAREMIDPETLSDSELQALLTNERLGGLYDTQEDVLSKLGDYSESGMSAIDRDRLAQVQNQINQQNRGNQEAIVQNLAQRGLAGSGTELAARLNAQQGSAQAGYLAGSGIASDAAQRAYEALQSQGAYATGLQGQQYGQMSNAAEAQDMINRYNTDMSNTVALQDWQNQQNISNMNTAALNQIKQQNTDLKNQATQYNTTQKPMQQYAMQSNQAQMAQQGMQNQANVAAQNAAGNMGFWGGLIGSGIQGGAYYYGNQPKTKTQKEPYSTNVSYGA